MTEEQKKQMTVSLNEAVLSLQKTRQIDPMNIDVEQAIESIVSAYKRLNGRVQ